MVEQTIISAISCPRCKSSRVIKNGFNRGKQKYKCKDCNRYFQENSKLANQLRQGHKTSHHRQTPEKVLILLTSHRSGSTWLSDAIRCHPAIEYYLTPIVYEELGLYGRRYPGDLSNQADCTYELEVQSGKLEKIPQFDLTQDLDPVLRQVEFAPYAIEKCHPSFFNFDPKLFVQKIDRLENIGIEVKLVCLVRDPKSLMTSFMDYQQRKPSWYREIVEEKLVMFVSNTFKCIEWVVEKRSPLIFDYATTKASMPQVLKKIYQMLWSNLNKAELKHLHDVTLLAPQYTDRKKRLAQIDSPFLGKQEGTVSGGDTKYHEFLVRHQKSIERCYAIYENIVEQGTNLNRLNCI